MARNRRQQDKRPSDPRKAAEWDEAQASLQRTQADQAAAKPRLEQDAIRRGKAFDEGAKSQKNRLAAENAARKKKEKDRAKERAEYLKTPLTPQETVELGHLEDAAMSGDSIPPDLMRRLGDFRIRATVDRDSYEAAKAEGQKAAQEAAEAAKAEQDEYSAMTKGEQKTKKEADARAAKAKAIAEENKK